MSSCTYDNGEDFLASRPVVSCDSTAVTYGVTISAIMDRNCRTCHSQQSPSSGINLNDYAQVKRIADNGRLVGSITHTPGFVAMPQNTPKLSDCDVNRIKKWVASGAPNN
ncbi:cytochrome c [Hymenobacter algoricola]|uniref:Cytochrome c domain-containing protein n=1 Tax=Hymenobacter algoricola TaxID=486267 RepID=A0ABP7MFQ2_9BACT